MSLGKKLVRDGGEGAWENEEGQRPGKDRGNKAGKVVPPGGLRKSPHSCGVLAPELSLLEVVR